MGNQSLIPALKAHVGDWVYYVCVMKYGQVAREVNFAYELSKNKDLNQLIQRGITARTDDIRNYLLQSEHRFLGALIVAAWGGEPNYTPVEMTNGDGLMEGLDEEFGVLKFDGSQTYFALDGQHRLRAIKDAVLRERTLADEEICVLLVKHTDDELGRERTRRLFTNINRNARKTTKSEDIALDEDDGFAIVSRRLVTEHNFFSVDKRVLVFSKDPKDGEVKLAQGNIPKTDKFAVSTLVTLYEMAKSLSFGLDPTMINENGRPTNDVLDTSYDSIAERLVEILNAADSLVGKVESSSDVRELRAPKADESLGNPMMRPVVQRAVAAVVREIASQNIMPFDQVMDKLATLNWKLSSAPWTAISRKSGKKVRMLTQRGNVELLHKLLLVHLAPSSRAEIKRVRKNYRDIMAVHYPVSDDELAKNLRP